MAFEVAAVPGPHLGLVEVTAVALGLGLAAALALALAPVVGPGPQASESAVLTGGVVKPDVLDNGAAETGVLVPALAGHALGMWGFRIW